MARFVLICSDGSQPPLAPIYEGRHFVLECSTHFFLLQIGDRTDKVSMVHQARQETRRCKAGTAAPKVPPRVAATGDLRTSTSFVTTYGFCTHVKPANLCQLAAKPPQPLSLPPQSLGGGPVVAYPPAFPPACHVTYTI
jgi:hypothetical protein